MKNPLSLLSRLGAYQYVVTFRLDTILRSFKEEKLIVKLILQQLRHIPD